MTATGYAFVGLTIIVAMLAGLLVFAVLRFAAAASQARRAVSASGTDSALLTAALEEAVDRLRAQERAAAARAEASERLNTQIIASLTSGLIVVDGERRLQIVNPAGRRILRLPESLASAERALAEIPALDELIAESLAGKAPVVRRQITITREGDTMHLGVTVSPLAQGQGAICLFSDLTNVVALEQQLRLKETLARLGELTAGLAHEFRNGLATIHGYAHLLDPEVLPDPERRYVEGIREETQALGEVVSNFLKFARPNPISWAPVDLQALVRRAAEDVPDAKVITTGDLGTILGDEVLLRQAFSNLMRNSVDAARSANREPVITVHGRHDEGSGTMVVTVSDNGPGIADHALDKVFQPFFTTRPGGIGLGLAIVQKIVVSHNGSVTCANDPAGGASFTVTLPLEGNTSPFQTS